VVAFLRAQLDNGAQPRADLLAAALDRLSASDRRDLAAYGQRQRALLGRVLVERAAA
jgi:hypothetical protein